jgi:mono/diheme cytochrome c family protein
LADPALREITLRNGKEAYVADAVTSSIAGREAAFISSLIAANPQAGSLENASAVLAVAAATIMHSGNVEQTETLLARLNQPNTPAWIKTGLLDGVDRLIPRADNGTRRTEFISSEPKALIAYASSSAPDAPRAAELLKYVRWRGANVDTAALLAKLTPDERALYDKGRGAFAVCAACHQDEGQGMKGLAPALAGSAWVNSSPEAVVRIVLNGKVDQLAMPPLGGALDNETVAAILTYVRKSWGNDASPISPDHVESIRRVVANRDEPWSDEELQPLR